MNTLALRQLIEKARSQELHCGDLRKQIDLHLQSFPPIIKLPSNSTAALERFVDEYINQVPELLDAALAIAHEAGIEAQINPLLKLAEQFFLSPPEVLSGQSGLIALLNEAYLAHRLVEEVNDRYITYLRRPLIPLDNTTANVVAHYLIGEAFSNKLDQAVFTILEELLDESAFEHKSVQQYRSHLSNPKVLAAWNQWPNLAKEFGIELNLLE